MCNLESFYMDYSLYLFLQEIKEEINMECKYVLPLKNTQIKTSYHFIRTHASLIIQSHSYFEEFGDVIMYPVLVGPE